MHQIAYISHATGRNTLKELTELCASSSAHNRETEVTGLLLYDGKRFMQVIEGDLASVRTLMGRISADERHNRISYIANHSLSDRQFGSWALACVGFNTNLSAVELLADVKKIVSDVTNPTLKAAFIGFALLAKEYAGEG
jgi:hypothetical protein